MTEITHFPRSLNGLAEGDASPEAARNGLNRPEQRVKVRRSRTEAGKVVPSMGTIIERHLNRGKKSYCAQIVVKRDGKRHREAKTFGNRASAQAWINLREGVLSKPGAFTKSDDPTLAEVIDRYLGDLADEPGRTKTQVLRTIKTYDIAGKRCSKLRASDYVDLFRSLRVKPQTRGNYAAHLSAVVSIAEAAWSYPLDYGEFKKAVLVVKRLRLTSKSERRDRRPTLDELEAMLTHFAGREARGQSEIPMTKIVPFALFSTRRLEEITRIRRSDYQPAHGSELARVLVRDMKNPGQKRGNDIWCDLPPEAAVWIEHMLTLHGEEQIFPFNHRTIGTYWTDGARMMEIENLHFHDLRHEGVSRLFEMDWSIPRVSKVSGHQDWNSLRRYAHLRQSGDKYENWKWKTP